MIKQIISSLIPLIFLLSIANAQQVNKFSFGLIIAPEVSWGVSEDNLVSLNATSNPKLGLTSGIMVDCELLENWSLRSGILFSIKNYQYKVTGVRFGSGQGKSTGIIDDIQMVNVIIPFRIVYFNSQNWNITAGINFTKNINAIRERELFNPAGEQEFLNNDGTEVDPVLITFMLGFGKSFQLGSTEIELQPYLEYSMHDIEHVILLPSKNQFSLGLGLSYWLY